MTPRARDTGSVSLVGREIGALAGVGKVGRQGPGYWRAWLDEGPEGKPRNSAHVCTFVVCVYVHVNMCGMCERVWYMCTVYYACVCHVCVCVARVYMRGASCTVRYVCTCVICVYVCNVTGDMQTWFTQGCSLVGTRGIQGDSVPPQFVLCPALGMRQH